MAEGNGGGPDRPASASDLIPIEDEFWTDQHARLPEGRTMIRAANHVCPRCGGGVPTPDRVGEYPGALSRTDNLHEICSACGQAEGMEDAFGGGRLSQSTWRFPPPAPGAYGSGKGDR